MRQLSAGVDKAHFGQANGRVLAFGFTVITARASSTAEVGIVTIGSVNVVPAANGAAKVAVLTTV
jgi:hypothetical protein